MFVLNYNIVELINCVFIGNVCKSNNSVFDKYFFGNIKCRNDIGNIVVEPNHLSFITRIKYCGGIAFDVIGTVNCKLCC